MSREVLVRMQSALKEAGFANFVKHESAHSWTLSADKAGLRALVHLTDQEELPYAAGMNPAVPVTTEVRLKATLPGAVSAAPGQVIGRAGQGGGSAERVAVRPASPREATLTPAVTTSRDQ
jgi:hypothetical protein